MLDLFEVPPVPGLAAQPHFITREEEEALIAAIDTLDLTPFRFQQWTGKRLTRSFGWKYDFASGALSRGEPLPDWLQPVRERAEAFAGLLSGEITQALMIRYDPGAGIGWHKDRPIYEHVVGLSLGVPATMRFRRKEEDRWQRISLPLEPRGLYHLSGEVRHIWEHSIAEMDSGKRYSITFRSFSDKGRRLAAAP
ncbi:alpha-ketoglutarate-dependent dioxygenase AlkB [Sphingomonas sp.]|uniref:alpha-ketoglutarate-dependent dioxygenase AlkB n=1 Tax=Sphingomonas sp. TaxID=28214 RepID=UPI000DB0B1F4|nr:alpha-ketoglutarate-dependent dioxygenase AlkB [Sphingomonas sp.]PZU08490.1 MAG: 2OG-Fe(II) oxygenase [Sphingomonas sp.]